MRKDTKVFITGHQSLIRSALFRCLNLKGFNNIITITPQKLDLTDQYSVYNSFKKERPEYVFLTYAKSGGIVANSKYPAEFIYHNLQIQNNVIHSSYKTGATKLLFWVVPVFIPRIVLNP